VNPAETRVDISDGKWEQKNAPVPSELTVTGSAPGHDEPDTVALSECGPPDLPGNPCTRKSSKAKRVKSYLKKCKDVALGHTEDREQVPAAERDKHEGSRVRNSRTRSNSGNREVSSTSWYVAPDVEPSPRFVSVVEVVPQEQADETGPESSVGKTETASVPVVTEQREVACGSLAGGVLGPRDEGGTCAECVSPQDGRAVPELGVPEDCASLCVPSLADCIDAERVAPQPPEVSTASQLH
jgi:hypothetical protein